MGDVLVTNNGDITGTVRNGVETYTFGNTTITDNGDVTGAINGIAANYAWASPGDVTISGNKNITGGGAGSGIVAGTGTGNIDISAGAITSGGTGIWAVSSLGGNVIADGAGTGTLTGTTVDGALVQALGNATVSNFATVTGARNGIYVLGTGAGTTTDIQGNGLIGGITGTALNGIVVGPTIGATNIGTTATNGVITGGVNGIWVNGSVGPVAIVVDKDVTGTTLNGIIATTTTADITIDIGAGATVQGLLDGVATGTTTGTSTTTNEGIVKNIADTGAADTAGLIAYQAIAGTNVLNNTGDVIGGITTAGITTTFNNDASGLWIPSLVNAAAAPTDINNAGTINVRTGNTIGLQATTTLTNSSGGVIDMTYGGSGAPANAKDTLNVLNFTPASGSKIKMNVDFNEANNSGTEGVVDDHSSNGKGTADTILVWYGLGGKATPQATSVVDMAFVGTAATGTSGSIALVNAVAGGLKDPGLGGFATMIASSKYVMAADPSTGAVIYKLVEDSNGGVYLQWAPNVSAASLGAFGGAVAAASDSGTSGAGAGGSPAGISVGSAIASSTAGFNGVGGLGLSGGPSGGGAAGHVADMAAADAMSPDQGLNYGGGSLKDGGPVASGCNSSRSRGAWVTGEVSRSNYDGGGDGRSDNVSGGIETSLNTEDPGCRKVAVGVFGYHGNSDTSWQNGSSKTDTDGVGAYVRMSSPMGLYGSLLGAVGWSDSDLTNAVYASTASKDATNYMGVATLGIVSRLSAVAYADFRAYVAYGTSNGDGFADSQGIVVDGTNDDVVTVGGSVGLYAAIAPTATAFVRGGVKWAQVDSSITAFGITQSGSVDEVAGSVEAGINATADNVSFGASGFGDVSESMTGYGGRAQLGVKF